MNYRVDIVEDAIYIYDVHGEVVSWNASEVAGEPGLAFVIADAVRTVYEKGVDALRQSVDPKHVHDYNAWVGRKIVTLIDLRGSDLETYLGDPIVRIDGEWRRDVIYVPKGTVSEVKWCNVGSFGVHFSLPTYAKTEANPRIVRYSKFQWADEGYTFEYVKEDENEGT